ncbi:MAG: hypothetical protein M0Z54_12950 [Thermaerobacter sp.]|nr:hypothetical protein [Thermaerobacter sp.]
MTVAEMEMALERLGRQLADRGVPADIVMAGGAWMTLVLGARDVTKDMDAYLAPPTGPIHQAIHEVAQALGLAEDWLNDGIKGFFFREPPQTLWREFPGLRVYAVSADYMLALKIYAARGSDTDDAVTLIRHLGLHSIEDVLAIVEQYVPERLLTVRHKYFAEGCMEEAQ